MTKRMKKMDTEKLDYLVDRLLRNPQAGDEELKKWLKDKENRQVYMDFLAMKEAFYALHAQAPDVEKEWMRVCRRLQLRTRRRVYYRLCGATAAIAVLVVAVFGYLRPTSAPDTAPAVTLSPLPEKEVTLMTRSETLQLSGHDSDSVLQTYSYVSTNGGIAYRPARPSASEIPAEECLLSVPSGKRFHITLSDGTLVYLNADSKLKYPSRFSDTREVTVDGEAYFEVSKQEGRPFIVHCGDSRVEVLGTHFCVSNYPQQDFRTTLVEGSVKVGSGESSVTLRPDMQAVVGRDGIRVQQVNAQDFITWIHGVYTFKNVRFEEVMAQVGRLYDVQVDFRDEQLKSRRLTGIIDISNDLLFSLSLFNEVLGISVEASDGVIHINDSNQK